MEIDERLEGRQAQYVAVKTIAGLDEIEESPEKQAEGDDADPDKKIYDRNLPGAQLEDGYEGESPPSEHAHEVKNIIGNSESCPMH